MTTINVGTAYSTYQLRHEQFDAGVDAIEAGYRRLAALVKQPLVPNMPAPRVAPEIDRTAAAAQKAARAQQQLVDSQVRAARAMGDYDRALELVNQELAKTEANTVRYNNLLTQQASISKQAAPKPPAAPGGGLGGAAGLAGGALGALGVGFGVQQVAQFGLAATQQALALRETKNSLRAITGDYQTYSQVLATAREQQILFGGTLQENIEGLSGLTITSRQSGAELATLIDLSQRLGVLDPAQGVAGARIALSEALSGDPVSLAKRYEIPKKALEALRDTSTPVAERLKIIDDYLNKVGITSEAVAGKVDQDAMAFRSLAAAAEDATTAIGEKLAPAFGLAATGLTRLLKGDLTTAFQALDQNVESFAQSWSKAFVQTGFNPIAAAVVTIGDFATGQHAAAQATDQATTAAKAQGDAVAEAAEKTAAARQEAIDKLIKQKEETEALTTLQSDLAEDSRAAAVGLFGSGDQAEALADKYGIAIDAARALIAEQRKIAAAAGVTLGRNRDEEPDTARNEQHDFMRGKIAEDIAEQKAINDAWDRRKLAFGGVAEQIAQAEAALSKLTPGTVAYIDAQTTLLELQDQEADALAEANSNRVKAIGTTKEQIALAQEELSHLVPGTVEYINKQTELLSLRKKLADESNKAGDRASKASDRAQKEAEREADKLKKIQDDYADHYRKLGQMQADYELSRSRNAEDFAISQRRLLAEGRIKEAALAKEDFQREQRRKQEDFDRDRQRNTADFAREHGGAPALSPMAAAAAAMAGTARPQPTGGAMGALAGAPAAAPAAAQNIIRVEIPIAVTMDGQQIATITGPFITQPLLDNLALQIGITTAGRPIGGQQQAFREIA